MDFVTRNPIACSNCAKAKAKCDKKAPCTRCSTKNVPCQARCARRSTKAQARKSSDPTSDHRSNSLDMTGMGKPALDTDVSMLPHTRDDHHMAWMNSPTMSNTMGHPSILGSSLPLFNNHLMDLDNSMKAHGRSFSQGNDQQFFSSGLTQSPPDFSISPKEMEDFMRMNGSSYERENSDQMLMMGGTQTPLELDFSTMPDFMSPASGLNDMTSISGLESNPGLGKKTLSEILQASPPSLTTYDSSNTSASMVSSLESPRVSPETRPTVVHRSSVQEHDAVVLAQEGWAGFRCNPTLEANSCPKTAIIHLEGLEQTLTSPGAWDAWGSDQEGNLSAVESFISTEPFQSYTREKLLAITQSFLTKALDIHRPGTYSRPSSGGHGDACTPGGGFIILPPPNVLEYFLRSHVYRFEQYYGFIPGGLLQPNEMMQLNNSRASSLLLLLMVAQGAMATPTIEARHLCSGLTEACRISLFDIIEKDVVLAADPIILRCALLFMTLAAWSGDKWQMDISMGQRGMYIAMLNHAGLLDFRELTLPTLDVRRNPEAAWAAWKEHESRSRLVYSWVTVDQEISLFYDTVSMLSVINLHTTMPDTELLWQARNSTEWLRAFEQTYGAFHKNPLSLCDLFRRFMDGEIMTQHVELSPTQLRLLLHPIQALVCHLRQFLSCFSDGVSQRKASRAVTKSATRARLDEVQSLLQQWYALSCRSTANETNPSPATAANLIIYHLISLNTVISFPEIERLARRDGDHGAFRQSSWQQLRSSEDAEEIFLHCGQVLRWIKMLPESVRPPWWAAAVYRVALVGWANSMANAGSRFPMDDSTAKESEGRFPIDSLAPDHPSVAQYLKTREGSPMFTTKTGEFVALDVPANILAYCVDFLEGDDVMRFTDGIKNKLARLGDRWKT